MLFLFTACCGFVFLCLLAAVIVCWCFADRWVGGLATAIAAVVAAGLLLLASVFVPRLMLAEASRRAAAAFKEFQPNLIIANSIGCSILFNLKVPKTPLLLLSPSCAAFRPAAAAAAKVSLRRWPYTLVVLQAQQQQQQNKFDEALKLIQTAQPGSSRLEILESDSASFKRISSDDLRSWVEEVWERGRQQVLQQAQQREAKVDLSLFLEPTSSSSSSAKDTAQQQQ
ncbi:hypothetical protein, conserved [Eimeria tenella]|uniref:Uncharacterized protein n=1 Tax=Eimeria tenella TaxID=5802 RepID=U6KK48_EIMTE|nr:hypothetical protein, conserved [Eimeria tenella]CDJ38309.1 hypothetical protein, conserved [Eimeria tenella]|eukprot:XP_013229147.1 hypothetical protein, conserved [Eimeria tenella]